MKCTGGALIALAAMESGARDPDLATADYFIPSECSDAESYEFKQLQSSRWFPISCSGHGERCQSRL